mgnify:CR=1 FL=1
MKKLLMGNEAIALGAIKAGVNVVCGYPGTPSTEVLETVAKNNDGSIYVEWSVNEKSAMELGAGACYAGARVMVTMKQVGLNVASDPLMSLAYIGTNGGMVILVADDPGPISSQTEQDTRHFAKYSNLPVLDPSTPEEAYEMVQYAFELSERFKLPVFLRPTTRVCHACSTIDIDETKTEHKPCGFAKSPEWVIFPALSCRKHGEIEKKQLELSDIFSDIKFNSANGSGKAVAASGVSYTYVKEVIGNYKLDIKLLKLGAAYPFPSKLALEFLSGQNEVLVIEELDPVIEDSLIHLCGQHNINAKILGKASGSLPYNGEYTYDIVKNAILAYMGMPAEQTAAKTAEVLLPVRPPVLCAGCPHRASFYAVKTALKGKKAVFSGDIGCYTLGNASQLEMVDTCLCMGAGITIAQGLQRVDTDTLHLAFIGDSTFFHTGIPGVINAVYNNTKITVVILDNSTTAMTGHQPHPGTGKTMMGGISEKIDIEAVLKAIGVSCVVKADPLDLKQAQNAIRTATQYEGVSAVIYKSPCIALFKSGKKAVISDKCIGCKKCVKELGCPAIAYIDGKAEIDSSLCCGCGLCAQVCPAVAIDVEEEYAG